MKEIECLTEDIMDCECHNGDADYEREENPGPSRVRVACECGCSGAWCDTEQQAMFQWNCMQFSMGSHISHYELRYLHLINELKRKERDGVAFQSKFHETREECIASLKDAMDVSSAQKAQTRKTVFDEVLSFAELEGCAT